MRVVQLNHLEFSLHLTHLSVNLQYELIIRLIYRCQKLSVSRTPGARVLIDLKPPPRPQNKQ